ncbi:uncharacterized protein LOC119499687 isoform X2 [Sebastes umbrosus]|uniref:uncharacterized protein LOC119499687 isoform X2 n=1 Tax=Sebastes umbrosus TaxID=72105 RepID=UPI00189CAC03|nr:uncharacterized protein LOC119499687 isoform X2 [Sebastes umbrosus]
MLKFESVSLCLIVIMFSRNQAALLSIHLLIMCQLSAEILAVEHKLVSRGDSVIFTCNISRINVTQFSWTKGRSFFIYSYLLNQNFSNFTSHRVRIDVNLPSKLSISNIQYDDAGLYRCNVTDVKLIKTLEWNLTVSEPQEISPSWSFLYILTAVIGFLLCLHSSCLPLQDQDPKPGVGKQHPELCPVSCSVGKRVPAGGSSSTPQLCRIQE